MKLIHAATVAGALALASLDWAAFGAFEADDSSYATSASASAMASSSSTPGGPQRLVVPLSQPGKPASISVSLIQGGVEVEAYDGKEIIVEARLSDGDEHGDSISDSVRDAVRGAVAGGREERDERDERRRGEDRSRGMRRIPNQSFGLSVEERDNEVEISAESWRVATDLRVLVPASTRLEISCVNSGDIKVEGVTGDMELSNVNGNITVDGAAGAVTADTVNGELTVVFRRLQGDRAMAFNSLNGDVELSFPSDLKASVALRTDNGEIFSDFDVALDPTGPRVKQEKGERGGYRVVVENGVRGTIGGGGREIQATTFNGNIYLKRAKP
jgi:hypothetical protein